MGRLTRREKREARENGFRRVFIKKEARDEWLKNYAEQGVSITDLIIAGMHVYEQEAEQEAERAKVHDPG